MPIGRANRRTVVVRPSGEKEVATPPQSLQEGRETFLGGTGRMHRGKDACHHLATLGC